MGIKIGVLALQGDVSEHIRSFESALENLGVSGGSNVFELRSKEAISGCDALVLPGGESTTISCLIDKNGMREVLANFRGGFFATCAGLVILAKSTDDDRVRSLGVFDVSVGRNAFGRQRESFEVPLDIDGLDKPFNAVFIRAPVVLSHGPGVSVLSKTPFGVVAVRHGKHMAFSFHPELTPDLRLHEMFLANLMN
ncbi:5'-phosphate synthase pdxT subunit [Methanomicrobium sp. W14]|uniref:pyridoxal 5'-phosphate synthase glutaminase subunit PdxT n=1 Tax=Methanomicrobium sp. W14 TaxID=2817839 RepID=UPI001AEB6C49|nr:5'-phosphate synthase pdxT subunit [Methanomicrobium sp. W14]